MPPLEPRPSPHRWTQVRRLELYPDIRTLDQYEQAVLRGSMDALTFLRGIEVLRRLSVGDLQVVHHLTFREVHPWAGQFRKLGQMATVAGYPPADPQRILRELELSLHQTREWLESALTVADPVATVAALAFLHVRFERVHPFQDGNGRAGRTILAAQFERVFGSLPSFRDQAGYRTAMRASSRRDLAPLVTYLGAGVGPSPVASACFAPFRVGPRFLEEASCQPTFVDDLRWSRSMMP